jgi:riboflavin biosynthesis pyrimidine reductase
MPNAPAPAPAPLTDAQLAFLYAYPAGPDQPGPARPWARANMVASIDGAAAVGGLSGGLSSPGDRRLFWALRALADVIVVGAGTARAEGYHPTRMKPPWDALGLREGRPAAPPLALVSQSLRLDPGAPLIAAAPRDARTIVITCGASPADRRAALAEVADVIVAGDVAVDLPEGMAALAGRGLPRILCEGGPTLLATIAAAGALDELCLTLSPVLAGPGPVRVLARPLSGSAEPTGPASAEALFPARRLRLAQLLEEDGNLFARYLAGE